MQDISVYRTKEGIISNPVKICNIEGNYVNIDKNNLVCIEEVIVSYCNREDELVDNSKHFDDIVINDTKGRTEVEDLILLKSCYMY